MENSQVKDGEPRTELSLIEYNKKLLPTDRKILLTLALNEKTTFYTLTSKNSSLRVGSGSSVNSSLRRLESLGFINIEQEKHGRRRKWCELSQLGLVITLSLDEFWDDSSNLDRASIIHDDKLPLLLGKLNFYRETVWGNYYIDQLKRWVSYVLEESHYSKPAYDRVVNKEEFLEAEKLSFNGLNKSLQKEILDYPQYGFYKPYLFNDVTFRLSGLVLGLVNIANTEKYAVPSMLKRFIILKKDRELMMFIDDYFNIMKKDYELKMKRLNWWRDIWEMIKKMSSISIRLMS